MTQRCEIRQHHLLSTSITSYAILSTMALPSSLSPEDTADTDGPLYEPVPFFLPRVFKGDGRRLRQLDESDARAFIDAGVVIDGVRKHLLRSGSHTLSVMVDIAGKAYRHSALATRLSPEAPTEESVRGMLSRNFPKMIISNEHVGLVWRFCVNALYSGVSMAQSHGG